MSQDPARLARDLFRVLSDGDPELALRTVAPDNVNDEAVNGPPACAMPGPAGTLASSAWLRSAFTDLRFPLLGATEAGDQVWVRLRMQGRHTGPFVRFAAGRVDTVLPPSGRAIDAPQLHVLTVRDGQVLRHEALRDDLTMLGQLGAFPPQPATLTRMLAWRVTGRATRAAREVIDRADRAARQA